jgi:hypothetical protein
MYNENVCLVLMCFSLEVHGALAVASLLRLMIGYVLCVSCARYFFTSGINLSVPCHSLPLDDVRLVPNIWWLFRSVLTTTQDKQVWLHFASSYEYSRSPVVDTARYGNILHVCFIAILPRLECFRFVFTFHNKMAQ